MAYKLAVFDFDGTLANTLPWFISVANEVSDRYGIRHVDESEYDALREMNPIEIMKYLNINPLRVPAMATYVRKRMAHEIEEIALVPGMADALRTLFAAGVELAVVSSNARANVRKVLGPELSGLMVAFETGVALFGKPQKLRHVLNLRATAPEDAMYFGDEIRDVEAALAVGMASGAVTWGYNSGASLAAHGATVVFRAPEEIVGVVTGE
ncbi:MAG: HAD hydrolase-like protein [Anaerolineae bacterium]|jgi:phosphoglycolate phosphatase|nr:HAD hydrolase-like protein [Anaerolineae bacterium]